MTIEIRQLIRNPDDIPMLPHSASKILQALNDENVSPDVIANLISMDVSLTIKILRLVNSPYFGLPTKISTIPDALKIIGLSPIGPLVLATSLLTQFTEIPENHITMKSFWSHGIACGIAAKLICKKKGLRNEETLYIAGMIHDIGSLIIYKEFPNKSKITMDQCNVHGKDLIDAEQETLRFNHAQAGSSLIKAWELSEILLETTEYHHQPLNAPTYKEETAIVYLADYIIHSNQLGSSGELRHHGLNQDVLEYLDLSMKDLVLISKNTIQNFEKIYEALTS